MVAKNSVPKQWNSGHLGVQKNVCGPEIFLHVQTFFFPQEICIAGD